MEKQIVETRKGKQFAWSITMSRGTKAYYMDKYSIEGIADTLEEVDNDLATARTKIMLKFDEGLL